MSSIKGTLGILCLSALAAIPMYAATPNPIKNSVKYKDAGTKPATGRSGSAAIQVRALRGPVDTDIEVTTGQFESTTTPAGKLDKVQVKLFGTSGVLLVTDNYRKGTISGGYGTFAYSWPLRGQSVQVQANVSGIDPKRTDVVTVPVTVKLRPDLIVASVNAPGQAYLGSVVTVDAIVREGNGDVGARANCVLKADGVVVDSANGIWVDAGDAVTVEFRTLFNTLGHKQLTVELTGVAPADYNTANNSGTAAIDIVSPSSPLFYTMSAQEQTYDTTTAERSQEVFTSLSPSYQDYVRDTTGTSTSSTHVAYYGANLQVEKPVEFPVALESRLIVDGQPLIASSSTIDENPNSFMNFSGDGYWNRCGDSWDGYHFFFVCHFHSDFDGVARDLSTAFSSGNAGTVTYASTHTSLTRFADGSTDVYTDNYGGDYVNGELLSPMPATLGNNVSVHGSFTDAGNHHYETEASVQLFATEPSTLDNGESCYPFDYTIDGYARISGYGCAWPVSVAHGAMGENNGQVQY
jgi:hypothetical protein